MWCDVVIIKQIVLPGAGATILNCMLTLGFPKRELPKDIFPSENLSTVQYPNRQLTKSVLAAALGPLSHPSRCTSPQPPLQPVQARWHNLTFRKLPLGKLHNWEITFIHIKKTIKLGFPTQVNSTQFCAIPHISAQFHTTARNSRTVGRNSAQLTQLRVTEYITNPYIKPIKLIQFIKICKSGGKIMFSL